MRLKNVLPLLRVIHISFLVQGVLLLGNMGLAILLKLLITLLLWTRICESCTMNKVCWLLVVIILCNYHADTSCYHKEANRKEEPKEPLGIVTEVATLIFLVALTDFLPFIGKHRIDLTDMYLHLCGHPLAFFGKQFLNLLPVGIINLHRHL